MANTLRLEIVTPEERTYSDDVELVVLPGVEGEIGIYPSHVPLLTELTPGELRVTKNGKEIVLAVGEGFAEVTATHINVLTDMAVEETAIDEAAVQAAIERAEAAMREREKMNDEEIATVDASLRRSLAQLRVKRRRSGGV